MKVILEMNFSRKSSAFSSILNSVFDLQTTFPWHQILEAGIYITRYQSVKSSIAFALMKDVKGKCLDLCKFLIGV